MLGAGDRIVAGAAARIGSSTALTMIGAGVSVVAGSGPTDSSTALTIVAAGANTASVAAPTGSATALKTEVTIEQSASVAASSWCTGAVTEQGVGSPGKVAASTVTGAGGAVVAVLPDEDRAVLPGEDRTVMPRVAKASPLGVVVGGEWAVPAGSNWLAAGGGSEGGGPGATGNVSAAPAIVTAAARWTGRLVRRRHARRTSSVNGRSNQERTRRLRRVRGSARSAHVSHEARWAGASKHRLTSAVAVGESEQHRPATVGRELHSAEGEQELEAQVRPSPGQAHGHRPACHVRFSREGGDLGTVGLVAQQELTVAWTEPRQSLHEGFGLLAVENPLLRSFRRGDVDEAVVVALADGSVAGVRREQVASSHDGIRLLLIQ